MGMTLKQNKTKTFITEIQKGQSVTLDTGYGDFITIVFDGMTSKNMLRLVFKLSENVVVKKTQKESI